MRLVCILSVFVLNSLMSVTNAAEDKNPVQVTDAWVREAPPNTRVLAGYMTLHNRGDGFRVLEKISSPDFEKVELHNMKISDGVVRMLAVEFLEIGPGKDIHLQPGGYHMMLRNPAKKLNVGDEVSLELHFRRMKSMTIRVPVMRADSSTDMHQHDH